METNNPKEGAQTARYTRDLDGVPDSSIAAGNVFETNREPTEEQIARRANQIWRLNGCPEGTAESDWFEAVAQLRDFYR